MLDWLKKRWELVLAALVGIIAFFLGRRGKSAAEDQVELKEEEIEVIKKAADEESKRKEVALQKYLREVERLREEYKNAQTSLEQETAQRKIELLELAKEDPDEIDRILMKEFNIARIK